MYLEVKNLSVKLGDFHLKDINLSIEKGEYLVLIGPTGSGKSVLIETIIGFYTEYKGEISLNGRLINNLLPEERNIGIVYQDHVLFPNMNVYENIAYGLKNKNISKKEIDLKIKEISSILKIDHILNRSIETLSGGESQRTALARTLIVEPEIILMDEPFSALDNVTKETLRNLIKEIGNKFNTTFIHITHDFNDVWALGTKVGVMEKGIIHQIGSVPEVFSTPETKFVAEFVGIQNLFEGKIEKFNSNCVKVRINEDLFLYGSDFNKCNIIEKNKEVTLLIRPENIIFSNESFESSARNRIKGKVVNIEKSGPIVMIDTEVGGTIFKGILTTNSFETLGMDIGKDIFLIFKSLNVKVIDSYKTI